MSSLLWLAMQQYSHPQIFTACTQYVYNLSFRVELLHVFKLFQCFGVHPSLNLQGDLGTQRCGLLCRSLKWELSNMEGIMIWYISLTVEVQVGVCIMDSPYILDCIFQSHSSWKWWLKCMLKRQLQQTMKQTPESQNDNSKNSFASPINEYQNQ
jgi:hypothetical protein